MNEDFFSYGSISTFSKKGEVLDPLPTEEISESSGLL